MDAIDSGIPVDHIRNSPLAVRIDAALAAKPDPEVKPVSEERHYCTQPWCFKPAVCSTFSWDMKRVNGNYFEHLGHWCEDHDTWWKRFQLPRLPQVPRKVRNHTLAFLTMASAITLALVSFGAFMVAAAAAAAIYVVCSCYMLLLDFFDDL